ncbi:MAG: hypothetical protein ACREAX_01990 [Candidatus Nitrosotenuis sp.]
MGLVDERTHPDANQTQTNKAKEGLKTGYFYENFYIGMNVLRTAKATGKKLGNNQNSKINISSSWSLVAG